MAGEYPQREKYFAHRFCRLLAKACVAQQIGPEACWLLTVIVQTEDAKRYTGPVFYWNEQLMAVCGFGGKHRLLTAREKAIGAGWLHYEAGTRGIAARYWVMIPKEFQGLPDSPIDENLEEYRADSARNGQFIPCQNGTANERNPDGKPDTFIPSPSPSPKENKKRKKPGTSNDGYTSEFEEFWIACPRKVGKGNAWKAWPKAKKQAVSSPKKIEDESPAEFLTRRMRDYAASVADKDLQFVRHPATWLNGGNWDDEVGSRVATDEEKKNWRP